MPLNKLMSKGHHHRSGSSPSSRDASETNSTSGEYMDTDDVDETDESGQSILLNIISQLKPGSDLSRITLPTFILEKKSMLERITNQLQFPTILLDAKDDPDELSRFVKVVKWYLSGWHIAPKAVKKPLNPVLGEHFTCYWDLPNRQQAFYIAEQVRHHPPESCYFYMIPESGIRIDGTCIPKSRFLGNSTAAIMEGESVLQFLNIKDKNGKPEKYILTQPNMYARGILFGKMRLEMGDHMIIKSPSFQVDVEFKTKGFISGTYDAIYGVIKDYHGTDIYEITGKWNDVMYIKDLRDKQATKQVLFDTHHDSPSRPKVRPLSEQGEYESRRLWKKVTDALARRDHETATREKLKIEDYQRELAKKRLEDGVEFYPKLFRTATPGEDLNYYIYKHIPNNASYETQIKTILGLAPILPGQKFTEKFAIPAYKKRELSSTPSTPGLK
ncbi:OSH7 (YHR001W) and OSH6 (YKR003W) [Zygosaccharomyces parabailii]|uniref:ZYBA0S05-06260g1_1 n=1 Tax=Zygosaccharomyces bailii (strain CLIB 213 / ATCC 58445 / CBS 680 / BCRC 21525 / NBRC 1098 / NCYC 1416 / NRRL Y-2227) TaxID=1333698 RepID=A0A8J2T884_ZYGB2|nr:OSH7 (YHR001W) and OSH6 (YKR003W) [Zygosaccharomyces parabailii]CDF89986.1 ZYBA0S05-06260g1_1 [Zygosaccharomyces bailii CLIB 213]CDH17741.1 probable Oxysterol-binding protein homolog 7 [Zygosaccharomyces bailii ISA1307]SJM84437.1 probable Oxysterol-binding protein homolog 7 [Zygosaccharomyces bailii]